MNYPKYYSYFNRPLRIERSPDGRGVGLILDESSGEFVPAESGVVGKAVAASRSTDIWGVTLDDFIFDTETIRARSVSGEGPVFALYQVTNGLWDTATREGRPVTEEELVLIESIYRRTFALWESGEALS